MTESRQKTQETGLVLGIIIILIFVGMFVSSKNFEMKPGPATKGPGAIFTGIYLQYWGVLFLLSYFFSHKCFIFRGLIWICENFSFPASKKMAFFYFALAFGIGTIVLLTGLGLI